MDKNFKFGLPDSVIDSVRQVMEAKKMKGVCPHCGKNPCECDHDHDEMDEELKGGQKKLDKNHNGKIDAEDFKILRKKKGMKEEVEEIDELSKGALKSYVDKAAFDAAKHGHELGKAGGRIDKVQKPLDNINKRMSGIQAATTKMAKEEVENIDELSKNTLKSYIKKSTSGSAPNSALNLAAHAAHKMTRRKGSDVDDAIKLRDKAEKRGEGIVKAASKLAKEEVEFSAEELARIEEIAANLDEVVTLRKMTPAEKKAHAEYLSKHSEKLAQAEKTAVKGDPKTFKQRNTEPGDYSKEPSKMGLRQSLADKGKVS